MSAREVNRAKDVDLGIRMYRCDRISDSALLYRPYTSYTRASTLFWFAFDALARISM